MEYITKILATRQVTHDVKYFRLEKPSGYHFNPGQATDVSINQPAWKDQLRPFTFTCLNEDPYLEFTIKRYPDHHGVTDHLHQLQPGDELILRDVWGAIEYKGPGYFIAGGAGLTPFMAILRQLHKENKTAGNTLFFSNKTSADIIYEKELQTILGPNAVFVLTKEGKNLTKEDKKEYLHARINREFLRQHVTDFHKPFYICGPDPMILEINGTLTGLGASPEALVFEK
jgi:ferredoxin-NADP reductase